jgi:hypothetical protein
MKKRDNKAPYKGLTPKKVEQIRCILTANFAVSPSHKAATELCTEGFTSEEVNQFNRTKKGRVLPAHWANNTINDMRDMEAQISHEKENR